MKQAGMKLAETQQAEAARAEPWSHGFPPVFAVGFLRGLPQNFACLQRILATFGYCLSLLANLLDIPRASG